MSAIAERSAPRAFDVLVAGAGPAGAIAARQLARGGLSVLLADRLRRATPKSAETLPGAARRLLDRLGLGEVARGAHAGPGSASAAPGLIGFWNGTAPTVTDALADPYGPGLRIDRAPFDAALRGAAEAAGARRCEAEVVAVERRVDGWGAALDDGAAVRAGLVIDATGRRACLARMVGERRRRGPALVALYRTGRPGRNATLDRTIVASGPDGWLYAGRVGERWTFGYHALPGEAARLRRRPEAWGGVLRGSAGLFGLLGPVDLDPAVEVHDARGGTLGACRGEGWMACGDAALAFDPIAGQGLFNAIRSGQAAAEAVLAASDGPSRYAAELAKAAAVYEARRRAVYGRETRWRERPFWQIHAA